MSRSNLTENLKNPAQFFFEWSSENKTVTYYNKFEHENSKGEKGETVKLKLPFRFLPLDILATIKGYNKAEKSSFWSNEIRSTKTDKLIVKCREGKRVVTVKEGLYDDIIASRDLTGAKFAQSIYIMWYDFDKKPVLANISFIGGAVGAWFDFKTASQKKYNDYEILLKKGVEISGFTEMKNGATIYYVPVFKLIEEISTESNNKAVELDKELQAYLTEYFKRSGVEPAPEQQEEVSKGEMSRRVYEEPPAHTQNDEPPVREDEDERFNPNVFPEPGDAPNSDDDNLPF